MNNNAASIAEQANFKIILSKSSYASLLSANTHLRE